mmetsp:Transcript_54457/g.129781  ORF Transcript_54457/g.129781 Transcript_54457/m.129781 type:complete len:147 (+) Transcript_54457:1348-1788(+)
MHIMHQHQAEPEPTSGVSAAGSASFSARRPLGELQCQPQCQAGADHRGGAAATAAESESENCLGNMPSAKHKLARSVECRNLETLETLAKTLLAAADILLGSENMNANRSQLNQARSEPSLAAGHQSEVQKPMQRRDRRQQRRWRR